MASHRPFPRPPLPSIHPARISHPRNFCSSASLPFPVPVLPSHLLYQTTPIHSSRPRAICCIPQGLPFPKCPPMLPFSIPSVCGLGLSLSLGALTPVVKGCHSKEMIYQDQYCLREFPGGGGASAGPGRRGGFGALRGGRRVYGRQRRDCMIRQGVRREENRMPGAVEKTLSSKLGGSESQGLDSNLVI